MIHAIGEQLATSLRLAGIPIPVVDGPERRGTATFARERVVLEHAGEDAFAPNSKATDNPETWFSRVVSYKATLYVKNPSAGSAEFEHRRRAEALLDQVLIGLRAIVVPRRNKLQLKSGKFVTPDDLKDAETLGGAVYELTFTIDRGVTIASWTGQAAPEATVGDGMIQNETNVTIGGVPPSEPV